jgi:hypothetical protein
MVWRAALREEMAPRLAEGYRWTALSEDGWAVLEPPELETTVSNRPSRSVEEAR